MEETDQDFYSVIDAIPSLLAEGQVDQAITLWDTTFELLGPHLSTEGKLAAMSFYAQALHYADLDVRAREVDVQVEEFLGELDKDEDISDRLRKDLLRDIAERWGIEVDDQTDTSASPAPPSEASAQTNNLSRDVSPSAAGAERDPSPRREQTSASGQMDLDEGDEAV